MQFLRTSWMQIRAYLEGLSPAQKWLILSLLVVLLLFGFIVTQYAASPELMPISSFAPGRQEEAAARLRQAGIAVQMQGGQVMVAADRQIDALVVLQQAALMGADTSSAFDDFIAKSNPWDNNARHTAAFLVAKQKVLAAIVGKMRDVRSADVVISMPEDAGFGRSFVRPSAAVTVQMNAGQRVDKNLVHAVAGLVAGAVAEMQPQDVVVIDAGVGRQFTVKSEADFGSDEMYEQVLRMEQYHRDKIQDHLRYIPNVMVAVNVQIDHTLNRMQESWKYEQTEPLRRERDEERVVDDRQNAGEAGVRPNTGMDATASATPGRRESETVSEREYGDKPLTLREQVRSAGRQIKQINVSINVPRSYFVSLWRAGQPADQADAQPTDADLEAIRATQISQIVAQVEPLISAEGTGVVRAAMIADGGGLAMNQVNPVAASGLAGLLAGGSWAKTATVGMLALFSLGLMLYMVRRATRQEELPSVEELAGVPPELPADDDLVGEAGQTNATLAGFELDDDELRFREMAGQIADMIKANPQEAGSLVSRWVQTEE